MYSRILEGKYRKCVESLLKMCLYSFRPETGTIDPILTTYKLAEQSWEWKIEQ